MADKITYSDDFAAMLKELFGKAKTTEGSSSTKSIDQLIEDLSKSLTDTTSNTTGKTDQNTTNKSDTTSNQNTTGTSNQTGTSSVVSNADTDPLRAIFDQQQKGSTVAGMSDLIQEVFRVGSQQVPGITQAFANATGTRSTDNSGYALALNELNKTLAGQAATMVGEAQARASNTAGSIAAATKGSDTTSNMSGSNTSNTSGTSSTSGSSNTSGTSSSNTTGSSSTTGSNTRNSKGTETGSAIRTTDADSGFGSTAAALLPALIAGLGGGAGGGSGGLAGLLGGLGKVISGGAGGITDWIKDLFGGGGGGGLTGVDDIIGLFNTPTTPEQEAGYKGSGVLTGGTQEGLMGSTGGNMLGTPVSPTDQLMGLLGGGSTMPAANPDGAITLPLGDNAMPGLGGMTVPMADNAMAQMVGSFSPAAAGMPLVASTQPGMVAPGMAPAMNNLTVGTQPAMLAPAAVPAMAPPQDVLMGNIDPTMAFADGGIMGNSFLQQLRMSPLGQQMAARQQQVRAGAQQQLQRMQQGQWMQPLNISGISGGATQPAPAFGTPKLSATTGSNAYGGSLTGSTGGNMYGGDSTSSPGTLTGTTQPMPVEDERLKKLLGMYGDNNAGGLFGASGGPLGASTGDNSLGAATQGITASTGGGAGNSLTVANPATPYTGNAEFNNGVTVGSIRAPMNNGGGVPQDLIPMGTVGTTFGGQGFTGNRAAINDFDRGIAAANPDVYQVNSSANQPGATTAPVPGFADGGSPAGSGTDMSALLQALMQSMTAQQDPSKMHPAAAMRQIQQNMTPPGSEGSNTAGVASGSRTGTPAENAAVVNGFAGSMMGMLGGPLGAAAAKGLGLGTMQGVLGTMAMNEMGIGPGMSSAVAAGVAAAVGMDSAMAEAAMGMDSGGTPGFGGAFGGADFGATSGDPSADFGGLGDFGGGGFGGGFGGGMGGADFGASGGDPGADFGGMGDFGGGDTGGGSDFGGNGSGDAGSSADGSYADGGRVRGPGTGISDSIDAQLVDHFGKPNKNIKLSADEYVLSKDVTDLLGRDFLDSLQAQFHTPAAVQRQRQPARSY